ncbi:glycosyltransferase family 4 protein [Methylobacterium oxalidis]|uniref:glycosyltransferase family 4 protein n=1 Tax=Methylobacterium oxalidis TaxID=944322 RepID=UPI0033159FAD
MPVSAAHVLMSADALGGVWPYTVDLAKGLGRSGFRVTVALMGPAPAPEIIAAAEAGTGARISITGLPLDWLADSAGSVTEAAEALARLAHEVAADLVHLHSPALAVAVFDVPVVAVCHSCVTTWWAACGSGPLPEDLAWRGALVARGCRTADALLAPTFAFAEATRAAYGLAEPPHVVRNGRRSSFHAAVGEPAQHAFTAGRLWDAGKNTALLDRVAARIRWPIRAAGPVEGPNGERLAAGHLRLLGRLDDAGIARELARRPVFVSLARYEPFGLAVLEAADAGCALVLSDIPTFRELWDGAALFVPPEEEAAASAIASLADEPGLRAALGAAARARASDYGVAAMVEGVSAVFRGLLAGQPARRLSEAAA